MQKILVRGGGKPLVGKIRINGSKNSVLPIMAASILCNSPVTLYNVPDLVDVHIMSQLLECLGAKVKFIRNKDYNSNHTLEIDCSGINCHIIPYEIASKFRASFLALGPMLSRFGTVKTTLPGGCNIGKRPVDMHISALEKMGAKVEVNGCEVTATVKGKLQGKEITFEKISVGATENIIMAATFAEGTTTINNAAIEPEVNDLIEFLKKANINIKIDNGKITIEGAEELNSCTHKITPDRIEAGTYALAAIITGGELQLEGIDISGIKCITHELDRMGARVESCENGIIISRKNCYIKSVDITTNPYPKFPSDMQPQFMSAMCVAEGISTVEENIFENRFTHVNELKKLGANISIKGNKATVTGLKNLSGSNNLYATDLRSTAALILASLVANGETIINDSHHLCRGYEAMHEKLNSCGADIFV